MSIRLMTKVFETTLDTANKFVLLAMADYGSDDGKSIYPSVESLSRKTSLSERTVQRCIQELIEMGWITMVEEGGGRSNTNLYQINQEEFTYLPPPQRKQKGVTLSLKGDTVTQKGDICAVKGDTVTPDPLLTISNPLVNRATKPEPFYEEFDNQADLPSSFVEEDKPKKPHKSFNSPEERSIAQTFSDLTGVKVPLAVTKRDYGEYSVTWWKPIREMLRQSDGDVGKTCAYLESAVEKQRKSGLPVGMPKSILNSYLGEISLAKQTPKYKDADGNWREL